MNVSSRESFRGDLPLLRPHQPAEPLEGSFQRGPASLALPHPRFPPQAPDLEQAALAVELGVQPPYQALALENRQDVIAVLALLLRHEGLEAVVVAEQPQRAPPVAEDGVERREQPDARRRRRQGRGAGLPVRHGVGVPRRRAVGWLDPDGGDLTAGGGPLAPGADLFQRQGPPEGSDLAGGGGAEPLQGRAAGPLEVFLLGWPWRVMGCGVGAGG